MSPIAKMGKLRQERFSGWCRATCSAVWIVLGDGTLPVLPVSCRQTELLGARGAWAVEYYTAVKNHGDALCVLVKSPKLC